MSATGSNGSKPGIANGNSVRSTSRDRSGWSCFTLTIVHVVKVTPLSLSLSLCRLFMDLSWAPQPGWLAPGVRLLFTSCLFSDLTSVAPAQTVAEPRGRANMHFRAIAASIEKHADIAISRFSCILYLVLTDSPVDPIELMPSERLTVAGMTPQAVARGSRRLRTTGSGTSFRSHASVASTHCGSRHVEFPVSPGTRHFLVTAGTHFPLNFKRYMVDSGMH